MTDATTGRMPPIADGAELERLWTGAVWSEGPAWLPADRVVRWSDIPGNRIMQFDPATGETTVHRDDVEYTNGRTLDLDGSVIQCSHGRRAVEREVDGEVTTLVDSFRGVRLNSPNDVVVRSDGTIWFTDPAYGIEQPREGHPGDREYGECFVFRFDPATTALDAVIIDMEAPNGIAFSPDESVLYVSDTSGSDEGGAGKRSLRAYDVVGDRCKNGREITRAEAGVIDGFRVDEHGDIWTSSADAVVVVDPTGAPVARIPVPETIANVCFGGDDGRDLYITASTSLYRIRTTVRDAAWGRSPHRPAVGSPVVVMGVSGSGKSTIGEALADAIGSTFIDGDTLHPQANKDKMAAGHPLDDDDRLPWLAIVAERIGTELAAGNPLVVACSALKRLYRDQLRADAPSLIFVHLVGSKQLIASRQATRHHEYMPNSLLESQFADLEPLHTDERGVEVQLDQTPEQMVEDALRRVADLPTHPGAPVA